MEVSSVWAAPQRLPRMGSEGVRLGKFSLLLCTLPGGPRAGSPLHPPDPL